MKHVCIDVGHTPSSPGAVSKSAIEYHQNIELANKIAVCLHLLKIIPVVVYRETYAELPKLINQTNADICISVHANAATADATGTETLYFASSVRSKKLADIMQSYMIAALDLRNRGIKPLHLGDRGESLVAKTVMPHVILEPYFLSNDNDLRIANEKMDLLSINISNACKDYFNI